jgi:hypothetical protein
VVRAIRHKRILVPQTEALLYHHVHNSQAVEK